MVTCCCIVSPQLSKRRDIIGSFWFGCGALELCAVYPVDVFMLAGVCPVDVVIIMLPG